MKKPRSWLNAILDARDFPGEILTGVPVVEIKGESAAVICNHRGVIGYQETEIQVATTLGPVTVQGCGLQIFRMNRERIEIQGVVTVVRLREEEAC